MSQKTGCFNKQCWCHFCGGSLSLTADFCRDDNKLSVGICQSCDLVQLIDFSHYRVELYSGDQYFPADLDRHRRREWCWNRKRVEKVKALIPGADGKKVLDFGCGSGGFLKLAQGVFREVIGYDISKGICQSHQEAGWICFDSLKQVPDDIEIITLFHVLEHIPEPWNLLTELKKMFSRAEAFVIEVPNHNEALKSVFRNPSFRKHHFCVDHLYYFTPVTLRKILEFAGLEVVIETQIQRYTLANTFGWLVYNNVDGDLLWDFSAFNDDKLNEHYERVLAFKGTADSLFFVCRRSGE